MYRFLLIIFLFGPVCAEAQIPFTRQYWLNESNSPVNVNALVQDTAGYLWLGTDAGLHRFNGRSFTSFKDNIHVPVTAVAFINGKLWLGYRNGNIATLDNNTAVKIKLRDKFPSSAITSIHAKGMDTIVISTEEEGIYLLVNNAFIRFSAANGLTDNFAYDALVYHDKILAGTDRGINQVSFKNGKADFRSFTTAQGLPDNIIRVLKRVPNSSQCWVGMQEGGIALLDLEKQLISLPKMKGQWAWGQVNDILPVSTRELMVATESGYLIRAYLRNDSLQVQPFTYEAKLKKIIRDNAGNLWCATSTGLFMNTALLAYNVILPPPYSLKKITAMECDSNGNIWYSQNNELYKVSPHDFSNPQLMLHATASITCICFDQKNNLWVGTLGKGLFHFGANNILVSVSNIAAIKDGHILSVASEGNKLWVSSLNGIEETIVEYPFTGALKPVRHHNKSSGAGSDYVYQIYPDSKGNIWMATDGGGVSMYDGRQYHLWDSTKGLTSQVIYTITEDANGFIWAGSLDKGLYRYDGSVWKNINQQQGLQDLNISALKGGNKGQVVVVSREGIDQWYALSKDFRHYNTRNGLHIDSTSEVLNCIAADRLGNVYVPFEHGFILFRKTDHEYDISPQVRISGINLFYKPIAGNKVEFEHDENNISFQFEGINYTNPEQLYYRYMLEGYANEWVYTGDEIIAFAQLAPGSYKFRVQSSLNNSFENANEDSYSFKVLTPYWNRWWFICMVVIVIASIIFSYIRIREHGLKKLNQLQKERMVHEYEHLKSQVNPHFLFNSLNTLSTLIEDDPKLAAEYTEHLSDLYRNMLSFKDQDLITVAEEYEIITNYLYIQQSRFGAALKLEIEIPVSVMTAKKIVPLALQLLLENAIKHNIVSRAKPLTIYITANEAEITVRNHIQPKVSKERGVASGSTTSKKDMSS